MVFTAGFCKLLHLDSSTYLRATVAWHPRYHRTISDYHRELTLDVFHSATFILSCAMRFYIRFLVLDFPILKWNFPPNFCAISTLFPRSWNGVSCIWYEKKLFQMKENPIKENMRKFLFHNKEIQGNVMCMSNFICLLGLLITVETIVLMISCLPCTIIAVNIFTNKHIWTLSNIL